MPEWGQLHWSGWALHLLLPSRHTGYVYTNLYSTHVSDFTVYQSKGCNRVFNNHFFSGVLCEINEDDCAPTPGVRRASPKCLNNGTCVDRVGGYRCNCPPGFTGERCEGDINECLSNPCNPSSSLDCIQLSNDYQCVCKPGFTGWSRKSLITSARQLGFNFPVSHLICLLSIILGRRCQNRFSVCESQPCQNGGACSVSSVSASGYICTCQLVSIHWQTFDT